MIFYLLIFMFFLGCTQVLWAIIHAIVTSNKQVRMHFGFYLLGVVVYFLVMWGMAGFGGQDWDHLAFGVHFYLGALILAIYHIWIVVLAVRIRNAAAANEHLI
jgi:hypothetical protein